KNGYLSVRFKPSSPYFRVIREVYKELLAIEAESGNKPGLRQAAMERAGERLGAILNEKGFADYDDFMQMAMATEMSSREKLIGAVERVQPADRKSAWAESLSMCYEFEDKLELMFRRVETFLSLIAQLESSSSFILNLAEQIHLLSLNSLISSHRLGEQGQGLAVVANDLARISGDGTSVITTMASHIQGLVSGLRQTAFNISGAKLQVGMAVTFLLELLGQTASDETRSREENDVQVLVVSFARSADEIESTLPSLMSPLMAAKSHLDMLLAAVKSLSRIHLIGRVEAANVEDAHEFLQLFEEVEYQLQAARTELRGFSCAIDSLWKGLPELEGHNRALRETLVRKETVAA
ncbi:MAG TPA: hypothetical protein VMI31_01650, partial [Fimbriimonadaceae bacterium]|nr:hypothetical protein [Fimbriimonadaceae bacterium]